MAAPKFAPSLHPRDRFGRFTRSRSTQATAGERQRAADVAKTLKPKRGVTGAKAGNYLQGVSAGQHHKVVKAYTAGGHVDTHKALRAGKTDEPTVQAMDAAMVDLPDDLVVSRRVPLAAFGSRGPQDLVGLKVKDAAYSPTAIGAVRASKGDVRMRIAVPKGTRAAVDPDTGEVILDRDLEMVVARVEDNGAGGKDMFLTVLPKDRSESKPSTTGSAPASAGETTDDGADVRVELMKLRVSDLQSRMRERGLKPGRLRKSQLVDALVADETGADGSGNSPTDAETPPGSPAGGSSVQGVGVDALTAVPKGLHRPDSGLNAAAAAALTEYQDGAQPGFRGINDTLRGGKGSEAAQSAIDGIDSAMASSLLGQDTVTYRGVRNARTMFGERLDGDLTGLEWREDAYVSTTVDESALDTFANRASRDPVRMRIVVPAGTGAVDLSDPADPSEQELLLDRGHIFKVVADRGMVGGVRQIDVEVQPKQSNNAPETTSGMSTAARAKAAASSLADQIDAGAGRDTIDTRLRELLDAHGLTGDETPELRELSDLVYGPEGQIRKAVQQLLKADGEPVSVSTFVDLVRVRALLPSTMDRATVDRALIRLNRDGGYLISESRQGDLTPERRAAAVVVGGRPMHLMSLKASDLPRIAAAARAVEAARR